MKKFKIKVNENKNYELELKMAYFWKFPLFQPFSLNLKKKKKIYGLVKTIRCTLHHSCFCNFSCTFLSPIQRQRKGAKKKCLVKERKGFTLNKNELYFRSSQNII